MTVSITFTIWAHTIYSDSYRAYGVPRALVHLAMLRLSTVLLLCLALSSVHPYILGNSYRWNTGKTTPLLKSATSDSCNTDDLAHIIPKQLNNGFREDRFDGVAKSVALYATLMSSFFVAKTCSATTGQAAVPGVSLPNPSQRPLAYSIEATNPPCLQPRTRQGELSLLSRLMGYNDAILVGEHQNAFTESSIDRALELSLLTRMNDISKSTNRKIVLGITGLVRNSIDDFDSVQKLIDDYVGNKFPSENEFKQSLEKLTFARNDGVSVDSYMPIFRFARQNRLKLGLVGLSKEGHDAIRNTGSFSERERAFFVVDQAGFQKSVTEPGFAIYANRVITPFFQEKVEVNQKNLLALSLIKDESIASEASRILLASNESSIIVLLAPLENVIYGLGVKERLSRNIREAQKASARVASVILNPTAADSLSFTNQLQLVLGYGETFNNQRSLADYIWFSSSPAVKLLTRKKNAISSEGDKPAGEGSILKAF